MAEDQVKNAGKVEGGAQTSTDLTKNAGAVQNAPGKTEADKTTEAQAAALKQATEAKEAEDREALLKKQEEEREKQAVSIGVALATPDSEPRKGKDVKEGQLVRTVYAHQMTDSLTLVEYKQNTWTEAKPSVWLDGQLRAGKIEVKG